MKLVVLAIDSTSTWMMVNALRIDYPDLEVVIEKPISRLSLIKKRLTRFGAFRVIGQLLFMSCLPLMRMLNKKRIQSVVTAAGLSTYAPEGLGITRFYSVNSEECIDWLHQKSPTVVVLNGTRIVSTALLESCSAVFLNTHCGITPAYRGVHGGYWALVQGDINNLGVTVHVVDAGVDTGGIVYQEKITVDEQDNFSTYPVKQYVAGIPLMRRAIMDVGAGRLRTCRRDDLSSAIWYHPTIWQYINGYIRHGVR